jgi:hypothetical protein
MVPRRSRRQDKRQITHRKADDARREKVVKMLVTEEEHALLQETADSVGASLSTWLRLVALRAAAGVDDGPIT